MKLLKSYFPFFIAGSFYALSFPFKDSLTLFPLIFISAAIYFSQFFKKDKSIKEIIYNTLVFLWAYNLTGYYWLTFTLETFGRLVSPFNIILWQLFTLIIAPQFYIFIALKALINKYQFHKYLNITYLSIGLSALWTIIEYYTPQQFPAHFGHTWLVTAPYLKLAQYFGAPVFSFITVLLGMTIYLHFFEKRKVYYNWVIILSLILINFGIGDIKEIEADKETSIRLVQANIGNDLKLKSENGIQLAASQVISIFKEMSLKPTTDQKERDLIIWPETSYPRVLITKKRKAISRELESIFANNDSHFYFGTYDLANDSYNAFEQQYNATVLYDSDGSLVDVYHKRVLIPFGEGLPFGPLNQYFAKIIKNISFFAKGESFTKFSYKDQTFISLICYEILFPEYLREYLNYQDSPPHFMINVTNDSWYGRYSEQEQHLFLSKWRALEFNLPMVRATNTGISAVILNNGLEQVRLGNFKQDILDFTLKTKQSSPTLYQRWGTLPFITLTLCLLGLYFILRSLPLKGRAS